jgi:hypothetical protein
MPIPRLAHSLWMTAFVFFGSLPEEETKLVCNRYQELKKEKIDDDEGIHF